MSLRAALWLQIVAVSCLVPPPRDVRLDPPLLTWGPGPGAGNASYSVQFLRFDSRRWEGVPSCTRTQLTSCDVADVQQAAEHGCVQLRVHAHEQGVTSNPVEACSARAWSCSAAFNLTARPGHVTVHLSSRRPMADEYGDHALQQLYCGREGEKLRDCGMSRSIPNLQLGGRYCVSVQTILYKKLLGAASCPQCISIPYHSDDGSYTKVVVPVVLIVMVISALMAVTYGFLFHGERIKKYLPPPCQKPELERLMDLQRSAFVSVPSEEGFDHLSVVVSEEELEPTEGPL